MFAASIRILLSTAALCAVANVPASGQAAKWEDQVLYSTHAGAADGFGSPVRISANRVFVGATTGDSTTTGTGVVQIFDLGPPTAFSAELATRDLQTGDGFGGTLAVSGDVVVVGAAGHDHGALDAGAAFVFRFSGGGWVLEAELLASDRAAGDGFGQVDIMGNTILVGAPGCDIAGSADQGAFYVFEYSGSAWTETAKLVAWDGVAGDMLGYIVAIDGDLAAASASMQFTSGEGAVYSFRRTAGSWGIEQKFEPLSGGTFGNGLDVEGDVIAIGQPYGGVAGGGLIFVERKLAGAWTEEAQLVHQYASALDQLGFSLQIQGDRLFSGARGDAVWGYFTGSGVAFDRIGGVWTETLRCLPRFGVPMDWLGSAVALDGDVAVLAGGSYSRSVFLYDLAPRVGTALCAGDGSGTPCPCANESGAGLGFGCANEYGFGASLAACGSASASADDLTLSSLFMVNATPVLLTSATANAGGGAGVVYGDGLLCIGGALVRLGVHTGTPIGGGIAVFGPRLATAGGWSAGDTRYFQAHYRDSQGPCGFGFNTTNALMVAFTP